MEPQKVVHPPLPLGLGSRVALTGIAGAIAAFIIAWSQYGLTPEVAALGVTAGVAIIGFFEGRSKQAAAAIVKVKAALGEAGIEVSETPFETPPPPAPVPAEPPPGT